MDQKVYSACFPDDVCRHVRDLGQAFGVLEGVKMKERLTSIALLVAMAAFGSWLAVMFLDGPPYIYNVAESFISPDPAPQGSMVQVDWKIAEINRICPGRVQRFFRDATTGEMVATLDTTPISRAVRKNDTHLPRAFQLPPKLPAVVTYSAEACFQCNVYVFPAVL